MGERHVWLNGALVDPDDARVSIDNHGLVVGNGAFETLKAVRGTAFALTRHLRRLARSLDALSLPMPSEDMVRTAIDQALDASGRVDARIRLTVTGGSGSLGSGAPTGEPTVIVVVSPLAAAPTSVAITVDWTRNEHGALAGLKTTSYAENVRMLRAAHDAGASEALMANTAGDLCEGTGTNVFVVNNGVVSTPPLSSGCLAGITRELIVEIADINVAPLPFSSLESADEVFLASSIRDVQGLTEIDGRSLVVGPHTERIARAFAALVASDLDP